MYTDTLQNVAFEEFEKASNEASELAERIKRCGHAGARHAEMIELLRAWQVARDEARSSHDRLLARSRAQFSSAMPRAN